MKTQALHKIRKTISGMGSSLLFPRGSEQFLTSSLICSTDMRRVEERRAATFTETMFNPLLRSNNFLHYSTEIRKHTADSKQLPRTTQDIFLFPPRCITRPKTYYFEEVSYCYSDSWTCSLMNSALALRTRTDTPPGYTTPAVNTERHLTVLSHTKTASLPDCISR